MSPDRDAGGGSDDVPDAARQLAGRLAAAFEQDQALAEQQNAAQHLLQAANGQLWSGLHPDALGLLYDDTHAVGIGEPGTIGSRITAVMADARGAGGEEEVDTVVLGAVQEIHWTIHRAFSEYQRISEDRRHLAAEIGELIAGMVAELIAAGWSKEQARRADCTSSPQPPRDERHPLRPSRRALGPSVVTAI